MVNIFITNIKHQQKLKESISNFTRYNLSLHQQILETQKFIEKQEDTFKLTPLGEVSTTIHEIHSLVMAETFMNGVLFDLTVEELVSVLSIFTDIRLRDDDKYFEVTNCNVNSKIKESIKHIKNLMNKYYDIESKNQTSFSENYEIHYDMCEFLYRWCFAG